MLERYAMKVARTVLRGGSGSNATPLPDHPVFAPRPCGMLREGERRGPRTAVAKRGIPAKSARTFPLKGRCPLQDDIASR
jgi:hypothetical protein